MRRSSWSHSLVAAILVLAMVGSISGLFGAPAATIRITSPAAGARVAGAVEVRASIRTDASIAYVVLGVDGGRPQSTNSAPYVFTLDTRTLSDGAHRIFVEAYDRYGLLGSSKVITIHINNGSAPAVEAQQTPTTQVAAKPGGESPDRTPAKHEARADTEVVSPRGPLPEPTRTAAKRDLSATRPDVPALQATARIPSGPLSDAPPKPHRLADRTRGHTVVLNGRPIEFDVAPYIADDRMRVGFRAMFERTGAEVSWIPETRTARSEHRSLQVDVLVGSRLARVNGREVDIGMPALIRQGRTMIPVRFFAAATGSAVYWDGETRTASVEGRALAIAGRPPQN